MVIKNSSIQMDVIQTMILDGDMNVSRENLDVLNIIGRGLKPLQECSACFSTKRWIVGSATVEEWPSQATTPL